MHKDQEFINKVWIKVNKLEEVRVEQEQKKKKVMMMASFIVVMFLVLIILYLTESFSMSILFFVGSGMLGYSVYYEYKFSKGDEHVL